MNSTYHYRTWFKRFLPHFLALSLWRQGKYIPYLSLCFEEGSATATHIWCLYLGSSIELRITYIPMYKASGMFLFCFWHWNFLGSYAGMAACFCVLLNRLSLMVTFPVVNCLHYSYTCNKSIICLCDMSLYFAGVFPTCEFPFCLLLKFIK